MSAAFFVVIRHIMHAGMRRALPRAFVPSPMMAVPLPRATDPDIIRTRGRRLRFHDGRRRSGVRINFRPAEVDADMWIKRQRARHGQDQEASQCDSRFDNSHCFHTTTFRANRGNAMRWLSSSLTRLLQQAPYLFSPSAALENMASVSISILVRNPVHSLGGRTFPPAVLPIPSAAAPGPVAANPNVTITRVGRHGFVDQRRRGAVHINFSSRRRDICAPSRPFNPGGTSANQRGGRTNGGGPRDQFVFVHVPTLRLPCGLSTMKRWPESTPTVQGEEADSNSRRRGPISPPRCKPAT